MTTSDSSPSETGRIDPNNPKANMYGALPCPKCKGEFRFPYKIPEIGVDRIECSDCGYDEPVSNPEYFK